ncbi:MAG: ribosome maturation factor RimM [Hyphomicrobiaceae bacterium]|nr:ribosome maturation factor RimM [Hyphomicrobiaceae bacterium]
MTAPGNLILIGRITGAHGIRGEVVIHSYAEVPEDIGAYGPLTCADGSRRFVLGNVRAAAKGVVARIKGVDDRNGAEALKGTELFVPRDRLPATAEGEYYVSDLIGLEAVDPQGRSVGRIVGAPDWGAGPLLEIRRHGTAQTDLVPFTDAYVPEVDIANGRVVVRPLVYAEDDDQGAES